MVPLLWVLPAAAFAAVGTGEAAYEPVIAPTVWASAGGGFTYRTAPGLVRVAALAEKGPVDVDWGKTRLSLRDGARVVLRSDGRVEAETAGVFLAGGVELDAGESLAVRSRFTPAEEPLLLAHAPQTVPQPLVGEEQAEMRMAVGQVPPAARPAGPPVFEVEGVPPTGLRQGAAEPRRPPWLTRWQWGAVGLVTAAALLVWLELWRERNPG